MGSKSGKRLSAKHRARLKRLRGTKLKRAVGQRITLPTRDIPHGYKDLHLTVSYFVRNYLARRCLQHHLITCRSIKFNTVAATDVGIIVDLHKSSSPKHIYDVTVRRFCGDIASPGFFAKLESFLDACIIDMRVLYDHK
jgi:hypothetical protein